jgi:hypothetical protein
MLSNKRHRGLSWFRPVGRTSNSGVLEALYYLAPGVPVVGLLQARRERKRGFQVPGVVVEDVVGEWEDKCVAPLVPVALSMFPPVLPVAGRVRPPFIDQGGSESHARRAI